MAISGWFSVQPCAVSHRYFFITNIGIGNSGKTPMTTSEQADCTLLNYILVCNCYEEFSIFAWKLHTITSMYNVHTAEQTHIHMENIYMQKSQRGEKIKMKMGISPEIIFISLVSLYQFYRNHSFLSCQKEKNVKKMHFTIVWLEATSFLVKRSEFSHQHWFGCCEGIGK